MTWSKKTERRKTVRGFGRNHSNASPYGLETAVVRTGGATNTDDSQRGYIMNRVSEFMVRFFMGQRLLHWIEKEATEGETLICDLYLKKGTEYEIRGRIAEDAGEMQLSIRGPMDAPISTFACRRGFAFIAHEEGMYQVWARIRRIRGKELAGRAVITVNQVCPIRNTPFDGLPLSWHRERALSEKNRARATAESAGEHQARCEERKAG